MKRITIVLTALLCMGLRLCPKSQNPVQTEGPARCQKNRNGQKAEPINMPLMIRNEDGSTSSYDLQRGDQLVYHVSAGSQNTILSLPSMMKAMKRESTFPTK